MWKKTILTSTLMSLLALNTPAFAKGRILPTLPTPGPIATTAGNSVLRAAGHTAIAACKLNPNEKCRGGFAAFIGASLLWSFIRS